jgi:putative ABC transport system permease protein
VRLPELHHTLGEPSCHIRLVLLTNGAVACAAVTGWITLRPRLDSLLGHRVDRFNLPWAPLLVAVGSATVTAVAAAWWPARAAGCRIGAG